MLRTVYAIAICGIRCWPVKTIATTRAINKSIINPGAAIRAVIIERTVAIIAGLAPDNIMDAAPITRKCVLYFTLQSIRLFYMPHCYYKGMIGIIAKSAGLKN
jgi:hypothetical protein